MEAIKTDKNITKNKDIKHWFKVTIVLVIKLILMFIVAKLSWSCNHNTNIILRLIITTISSMFSVTFFSTIRFCLPRIVGSLIMKWRFIF